MKTLTAMPTHLTGRKAILVAFAAILGAFYAVAQSPVQVAELSRFESNDRDRVVGKAGEVSRYQILPSVWREYHGGDPRNQAEARRVALAILRDRAATFRRRTGRQPGSAELYALWNAPGRFEWGGYEINRLPAVIRLRCERYDNETKRKAKR